MAKTEQMPRVSGFLDKDTTVTGEVSFKDTFRIDGRFKGKILAGNGLIIGENAEVEADIEVNHLAVNGRVKGAVKATEMIEIFANGRVSGSLATPRLVIEEGAFFQGSCQMEMKTLESGRTEGKDYKKQ